MMTLVFFLEELSAKEMLSGILPKILPDNIQPRFVVFEGKQDLEKQLVRRLSLWRIPNCQFFVLRDQDSGDCRLIKRNLLEKCNEANKPNTVVRVSCPLPPDRYMYEVGGRKMKAKKLVIHNFLSEKIQRRAA